MWKNYVLITLRNIARNKLFISINVLGLGVAIACAIVAYLNWDFSAHFDKNHIQSETIYRVQAWQDYQGQMNRYAVVPNPLGEIIRQNFNDVDKVVRLNKANANIRIGDEVFNTTMIFTDSAFFDLFSFELTDGSFSALHEKSQILISDVLARKYFDTEEVVGKQLTQINHGKLKELTIGGVYKEQPMNSSFAGFDVITLWDNFWETTKEGTPLDSDWKSMSTLFLKINDGSRTESIAKQLQNYLEPQNQAREDLKLTEYYLQNFKTLASNFYGESWLNGEQLHWGFPPSAVLGPGIMAIFLLLLACFNFTNTTIAIAGRRLKEIGIRKAMGGVRSQLVIQFLGETLILCFFALVVGLLLAELLVPAYNSLWPDIKLELSYSQNIFIFIFLLGLLLFTAILAGIYPALYITAFKPVTILKGKMRFGGTNWFTRALLTFQFSISLICIVSGIAYLLNAQYQRDYHLGYAKDGVIVATVHGQGEFESFRNALVNSRDIEVIAGSKDHVSDRYYRRPVKFGNTEQQVEIIDIGDHYLEAMDIRLLQGRGFEKDSETDRQESILISETFAKSFGWTDNMVGRRVVLDDTVQLYVVGVVNDILTDGFWKPAAPVMLRYIGPEQYSQIVVRTSSARILDVNELMKKEWKKISPNTLYSGSYTDGNMWASEMINKNVVSIFAFLGIMAALMSATGLFALLSLSILKKMKEIGVRKVLGASHTNIIKIISREFILILSIASVLGATSGYFVTDKMMDAIWEYYLKIDISILLLAISALFVVAICTVGFKTLRTAFMNPVNALRDE